MKKLKFNIFFFIIFFFSSIQAYSESNIALINLENVLQKSNIGKSILNEIDELNSKNINELKDKENELKKFEEEIKKKQNIISKEEFEKEINILKDKVTLYRKTKDEMVKNFENKRNQKLSIFFEKINPIIKDYMDEHSIDILLERKNVFIGKINSDITEKIINEVNKKFK